MKFSVQEFNKYKKNLKLEPYEKFAQDFLKKHFNLDLGIPLKWNGHLKRAVGRFISRNKTPLYIELGTEFFAGNELVNKMDDFSNESRQVVLQLIENENKIKEELIESLPY